MKRSFFCGIMVIVIFLHPAWGHAQAGSHGPAATPADSAAAIRTFRSATGGSGQYYAYLNTYTFTRNKRDSVSRDTMSMSIADNHNIRSDMAMFGSKTAVLGHEGLRQFSLILDPAARTYRLHLIDTAAVNRAGGTSYQVVKVGAETVQGYSCIHTRVTSSSPGARSAMTQDFWTSNDVPGYANLKKLTVATNINPAINRALEQAGCDGFIVKMSLHSMAYSLDMVLVQASRKDFPASLFELPAGYTPAPEPNFIGRAFRK